MMTKFFSSVRRRARSLATMIALGSALAATGAAPKPNFIFINIDDLGYADIEPFGSQLNRTPNLNRMAAEGLKLTCFYAAPVCSPSRSGGDEGVGNGHGRLPRRVVRGARVDAIERPDSSAETCVTFPA
jgi:hypothetical protein